MKAIEDRVRVLKDEGSDEGDFVLYWMQAAQRSEENPALEYAIWQANRKALPLVVLFVVVESFPEANLRHFDFMLRGLEKTAGALKRRNVSFVLRRGEPVKEFLPLARRSALAVLDRGYLRFHKTCYREVQREAPSPVHQVEGEAVVPLETLSEKREYAAHTIRKKVHRHLDQFLLECPTVTLENSQRPVHLEGLSFDGLLEDLKLDRTVPPVQLPSGTVAARRRFQQFLEQELGEYDSSRNKPSQARVSWMSPYLHYGQISPVYLACQLRQVQGREEHVASYLEELTVRRTLAQNFVLFESDYDSFRCLPDWCRQTLEEHKDDPRENVYTAEELETGQTHDPYWNAAQKRMVKTGYMHNHMRMYWGKQILTWTNTPEYAYRVALQLNNRYFLDGRDPSSFANVGWLFGLHDRPWQERAIFGKVRCMTRGGLERKIDTKSYLAMIEKILNKDA